MLRRIGGNAVLAGVYPRAVQRGGTVSVTIYGGDLPGTDAGESVIDFGEGVTIQGIDNRDDGSLSLRLSIDENAGIGARDLFAFGSTLESAIVVHDGVDRIAVTPQAGMARVGGGNFPKGYQTFEAIGYDDGPDGEPDTSTRPSTVTKTSTSSGRWARTASSSRRSTVRTRTGRAAATTSATCG